MAEPQHYPRRPAPHPHPHPQLSLQRRAPSTLRRHLARAAGRFAVLLTADLAAFAILRELYRSVGEGALLGAWVGSTVQQLLPAGYLDGWQYALALVLGLIVTGNYGAGDRRRDAARLLWGCALATALPLWAPLWDRGLGLVLAQFSVTTGVVWLAIVAIRLGIDAVDARVVNRTPGSSRTLLIGPDAACRDLAIRAAFARRGEHLALGFVDTAPSPSPAALGTLGDLPTLIQRHQVESVVICGHLSDGELRDVVEQSIAAGCHVFSVPRTFEVAGVQPSVVWKRGQPLVELSAQTLKAQQFAIKRVADVVGAVVGFIVLAPLLLAVAAVIKLDSPGPVLFRQRRTGLGGRPFLILKFRTMTDGADALKPTLTHLSASHDPRIFKLPNDPRVSRVGRWLRRWAVDELPQLWNVLVGEMSLVGPRPFVETGFDAYQSHHFSRLGAKPGITGLWQVRRNGDTVDFEEVISLDAQYIREWSLLLDAKILALTLPAVIRGRGAA
ncbi:MAG: exopolysaccharide biosynthesis polyprenyl glycosylphosphotransferase [Gemmatimonadales bacterium]